LARPFTFTFSTGTVDGRIASVAGYSLFSCDEDFELQHRYRAEADAVMVGAGTVRADDPRLTVRRVERGASPLRVVVDSSLSSVRPGSRLVGPGAVVFTTLEAPEDRAEALRRRGALVFRAGSGSVDLVEASRILAEELGVRRLMVEGGGRLICSMLRLGLVDEVRYTVAPYILGGGVGLAHCEEPWDGWRGMVRLALKSSRVLCGGWVHLVYEVLEPRRPLA
jgi:2,5-diamino-6-(ribosylamino)-4(3H)-pyrimidinone 5'-phosphate reductase